MKEYVITCIETIRLEYKGMVKARNSSEVMSQVFIGECSALQACKHQDTEYVFSIDLNQ